MFGRYISWLLHSSLIVRRPNSSRGWKNQGQQLKSHLCVGNKLKCRAIWYRQRLLTVKRLQGYTITLIPQMLPLTSVNSSKLQKCKRLLKGSFGLGPHHPVSLPDQNHNVIKLTSSITGRVSSSQFISSPTVQREAIVSASTDEGY